MKRIAGLVYDRFQLLDLSGPLTAFEVTGLYGVEGYSIEVISLDGGIVETTTGIGMNTCSLEEASGFDTLIIPGGYGLDSIASDFRCVNFLRNAHREGRRLASVCSGAFVLAAAGLLDGKRATTHWGEAAELAASFPEIAVDPDPLFIEEGHIWTSAGVTAGIDMALAMIERDYGADVAKAVARALVVPYQRPGAQSQQSLMLNLLEPHGRFHEVLAWSRAHLGSRLTVERMAEKCGLSSRQFARAFRREQGITPMKAVERMRAESARAAIESGALSLKRVAREHGFGDLERMRRAFIRTYGDPPQAIRRRGRQNGAAGVVRDSQTGSSPPPRRSAGER